MQHKTICSTICSFILNNLTKNENKNIDQGSISSTNLQAAFTPVAPKSVEIQPSCQYLFTLLGSMGAKAAHRTFNLLFFCKRVLCEAFL